MVVASDGEAQADSARVQDVAAGEGDAEPDGADGWTADGLAVAALEVPELEAEPLDPDGDDVDGADTAAEEEGASVGSAVAEAVGIFLAPRPFNVASMRVSCVRCACCAIRASVTWSRSP